MLKNKNIQNSHSFLALAFFRGICLSRHQRIWNQHKILRFFDTHIDIFQEKNFLGHNSTFFNLKMQMRKKLYNFKHFAVHVDKNTNTDTYINNLFSLQSYSSQWYTYYTYTYQ